MMSMKAPGRNGLRHSLKSSAAVTSGQWHLRKLGFTPLFPNPAGRIIALATALKRRLTSNEDEARGVSRAGTKESSSHRRVQSPKSWDDPDSGSLSLP